MGAPYADAARRYLAAGWQGPIPLPKGEKGPVPVGYTGKAGAWPSIADIQYWTETKADGNIALRLPPTVVGIDIDCYDGKPGAETIAAWTDKLDVPLPPTWVSSARNDTSGIRLYQAPYRPTWIDPGEGVEIIHYGWRYVVVSPSINPATDTAYRWIMEPAGETVDDIPNPADLPHLPSAWVDALSSDKTIDKDDIGAAAAREWLDELEDGPPCACVTATLAAFLTTIKITKSRHGAQLLGVAQLVRQGEQRHPGVRDALSEARKAFLAAVEGGAPRKGDPAAEWRRSVAGAIGIVKADPSKWKGCRAVTVVGQVREPEPEAEPDSGPTTEDTDPALDQLTELIAAARRYQDLPDPGHLLCGLATAVTRDLDDEPLWLLFVAAPSSGKTETIRMLDDIADDRLDEVTAAGMLSWKTGKNAAATGVLTRIPTQAVVTFSDLSSLLASSDRGGRDQAFALLRKAYDGHVTRDLGNAPAALRWEGKLTVIAAVTGVIDNYAAHADALGPRWAYYRLPARDTPARRRAAAMSRNGDLKAARATVRTLAAKVVTNARAVIDPNGIDEVTADAIEDAALVTCWGRAVVPRHGYGRREIDGVPIIEEPPRIIRQLRALAVGLFALNLTAEHVIPLTRRVALDSMPLARRQALDVLAVTDEALSASAVAARAGQHRHVTRRQLEELEAIGIVEATREGEEPGEEDNDRRTAVWRLVGADGDLVAAVIRKASADLKGWHEKWGPPTPPPQDQREDTPENEEPLPSTPHFVPPPDEPETEPEPDSAAYTALIEKRRQREQVLDVDLDGDAA